MQKEVSISSFPMVFDKNEKKKKNPKNNSRALIINYKQFFKPVNIFFISTLLSFALEFTMPQVYRSYIIQEIPTKNETDKTIVETFIFWKNYILKLILNIIN